MKSKSLSLAVILQITLCGLVLPTSHAMSQPCGNSSLRNDPRDAECRESIEKRRAEEKKPKPLEEPRYPFKSGFLQMADTSTGQSIAFSILSTDGKSIDIQYVDKSRNPLIINVSNIVTWKSGVAGQGSDSSGAISTVVAGALFFWPMILAAPFMVRNYTTTAFDVNYIDEFGKNQSLIFATIENPRPLMSLLKFATGLDAGASRPEEQTKSVYEAGLQASIQRLEMQRKKLLIVNSRRPWCSRIDTSKDTEEFTLYKQYLNDLKQLQKVLGLKQYDDSATLASDAQWEKYLAQNPGTRSWAEKFPLQAEKMKACN